MGYGSGRLTGDYSDARNHDCLQVTLMELDGTGQPGMFWDALTFGMHRQDIVLVFDTCSMILKRVPM